MKRAAPRVKKSSKVKKAGPSQNPRTRASLPGRAIAAKSITELVGACCDKVEKLLKPSQITYLSLFEYYDTEGDDPELWQCCWLVCLLVRQAHATLLPLNVTPQKILPSECFEIAKECEAQQRWLRPAIHVIRSIIYALVDQEVDHLDDMIPSLRKMERDINEVVGALHQVIHHCHLLVGRRAAR